MDATDTQPAREPAPKILVDAEEAGRMLSLSRSQVLAMAKRGELPNVRVGRLRRFAPEVLRKWAQDNSQAG